MITSASPARSSRSGSVSSVATSEITARGWWNAPIMFLPSAWLIAVLPPTEESTCASSVVGTCTNGDAALVDRGGEAREIADHAAAERDDQRIAPAARAEQRVEHAVQRLPALACLAVGNDDLRDARRLAAPSSLSEIERRHHLVGDDGGAAAAEMRRIELRRTR